MRGVTRSARLNLNGVSSRSRYSIFEWLQTTTDQTQVDKNPGNTTRTQPYWTEYLFKIVFGIYMLVSVVVLINLLIAMMSDTYQRIQVFEFIFFDIFLQEAKSSRTFFSFYFF